MRTWGREQGNEGGRGGCEEGGDQPRVPTSKGGFVSLWRSGVRRGGKE